MRLTYDGMKFSGTISEMKEYLEKKLEEQQENEIDRELMEKKDREDQEFMMRHQGDNMTFSG